MENTKLLRKLKFIIILAFILFISIAASNIFGKGWIFYNDGPYRGKVVDADTGEPIEGAVVVGMWKLEAYGGPAAPSEPYCDAQETITTKNGEFIVPKASCFFLWPFTKMGMAELVIFKPGFDSYPPLLPIIKPLSTKESMEEEHKYKLEYSVDIERNKNNLIRLKRAINKEERKWVVTGISISTIPYGKQSTKAGQMGYVIKQEEDYLGLYK